VRLGGELRQSALGDNALLQGDVHGDTVADSAT
jgi:hypothetical protein